jgi:hypothetical protein
VVEQYEGFEFMPLRIENAFDSSWWEGVGGRPIQPNLCVNVNSDGGFRTNSTRFLISDRGSFCRSFSIVCGEFVKSHRISSFIFCISSDTYRRLRHCAKSNSVALIIYRIFHKIITPPSRNVPDVTLDIPHIFRVARRRFCGSRRSRRSVES